MGGQRYSTNPTCTVPSNDNYEVIVDKAAWAFIGRVLIEILDPYLFIKETTPTFIKMFFECL